MYSLRPTLKKYMEWAQNAGLDANELSPRAKYDKPKLDWVRSIDDHNDIVLLIWDTNVIKSQKKK